MSATTNSTLRKKESDAENNAPTFDLYSFVGILFIVPIERNEEGSKKKTHSPTWNAPSLRGQHSYKYDYKQIALEGHTKGKQGNVIGMCCVGRLFA